MVLIRYLSMIIEIDRQTDRQIDRQTDRQTEMIDRKIKRGADNEVKGLWR
jgi:hypothetical protein